MCFDLNLLPPDPIYGMQAQFKSDSRATKVNLSIGVCLDAHGKVLRFKAIDEAGELLHLEKPPKDYLALTGQPEYCRLAQELVCATLRPGELFSMQSLGGTGALYLAASLLKRTNVGYVFVPEPSWTNHKPLFEAAGHKVSFYPYYDRQRVRLDFEGLLEAISRMPEHSAIILQASCHNPTGIDPTASQWKEISALLKKQQVLPIFDIAYLGFGDHESDLYSIRLFLEEGHEMVVATSFSKSFGLYNDRIGLLTVAARKSQLESIASHLRSIARSCYSSPAANGALLIKTLLQDEALTKLWRQELETYRTRLNEQRQMLYDALSQQPARFGYQHLLETKGLFCLLDLKEEQIAQLRKHWGVYVAFDGRIALTGITKENVHTVAEAMSSIGSSIG